MENNDEQTEILIPIKLDSIETSIQNKLQSLPSSNKSKCSIYKVPEFIRKENKECYRPSVISIGPVFYKDPQLQVMQELKWIYLESFLQHPKTACRNLDGYINIVRGLQGDIRRCYQEQIMISCEDDDEFIEMILFDVVFLLHFIMFDKKTYRPTPNKLRVLIQSLKKDLFLLENQVPFFVLKHIFEFAFPMEPTSVFIDHTRRFISKFKGNPGTEFVGDVANVEVDAGDASNAAHLVDFWRKCCCSSWDKSPIEHKSNQFPKTAKELSAAGVNFKASVSMNPFPITFNRGNGELLIPKLLLLDETEAVLRSMLFFEQCHYYTEDHIYFIDLIIFLDELIDNVEDVQILQQKGILENQLGSDEEAVNLFNKITKNLTYLHFSYSNVSEELNEFANKSWNRWEAISRRDYFNHPWAIISFIFAIILFILTVIQTVAGFIKN